MKILFILIMMFVGFNLDVEAIQNGENEIPVMDFDTFAPRLEQDDGRIYVVNFWATWCAPCVRELPAFEQLYKNFKDEGVHVLLVSLDDPRQMDNRVIPFVERMQLKSEVLLLDDPNSNRWIPLVSDEWTGAIPATVIYGQGFRSFYEREFKYKELEEIILSILK